MSSLNARIIIAASIVLAIFLVLTGVALDQAFRDSAITARQERLQGQLYLLIAAAEVDEKGNLSMPRQMTEPRLGQPASGLYASVEDEHGRSLWRSNSSLNVDLPSPHLLSAGTSSFARQTGRSGAEFFVYRMGVRWNEGGKNHGFTFRVAEDPSSFEAQLSRYRSSLWGWLAAMAALLLAAQTALLRWGLRPLRQVAAEIHAIERGDKECLLGHYPEELKTLTENLNGLLQRERAQQQRYRDALGDLAHSLKTPLAVMRGALAGGPRDTTATLSATVAEETDRMQHIVEYQLQRAATAGPSSRLAAPVEFRPIAERIIASLSKVYHDKMVETELVIAVGLTFRGDRGDLLELLGNLLDNAFKWSSGRVRLAATESDQLLVLSIEDDGKGIPAQEAERILQRGARADQSTPGQGIGLAVVSSILRAYGGEISIGTSPLGGAIMTVRLPI